MKGNIIASQINPAIELLPQDQAIYYLGATPATPDLRSGPTT
jgi:hypothetical protein